MKKTMQKIRLSRMLACAGICAGLLTIPQAHAGGPYPLLTFDPINEGNAASEKVGFIKQVADTAKTINQVTRVLSLQGIISNTLGASGSGITDIAGGSLKDVVGTLNMGMTIIADARSGLQTAQAMYNDANSLMSMFKSGNFNAYTAMDSMKAIYKNSTIMGSAITDTSNKIYAAVSQQSNPADIKTTQQAYINNEFSTSDSPTITDKNDIMTGRSQIAADTQSNSLMAAASAIGSTSAQTKKIITGLANAVTGSIDVRGDAKANNMISLNILQALIAQNQMLAWYNRESASFNITQMPVTVPSTDMSPSF